MEPIDWFSSMVKRFEYTSTAVVFVFRIYSFVPPFVENPQQVNDKNYGQSICVQMKCCVLKENYNVTFVKKNSMDLFILFCSRH